MTSEIKVDTISEQTSANGVTIDGLTIKDGNIQGSPALVGTTPSFTIGDGGAEDTKIVFDGNALDYYIGLDDSADNLIIGSGSTVGSNSLITIDSDGDLTLDITGAIILDADDEGTINFKDGGSRYGLVKKASDNFEIQSMLSDGDIVFKGNDGGATITALTLDMSLGGSATFNHDIQMPDNGLLRMGAGGDLILTSDGTNGTIFANEGNLTLDSAADIILDSDAANWRFKDGGTSILEIGKPSGAVSLYSAVSDADILFKGNDGGSAITALTLDMSAAGHATFNNQITSGSHIIIPATSRLYLDGSGDTFISEVAANAIAFTTGNTERMRIDSSGRIGIGTATLDTNAQVQIEGAEEYFVIKHAAQMGIKLYGDDTNVLYSYDKSGNSFTGGITFNHADGTTIFMTGGGNERMRIDATGAVTMPHQPAFLVTPSTDQTNMANNATIVFGAEAFDQNADFSGNVFTAPVTGKYMLSVSLRLEAIQENATYASFELVTSNRNYQNIFQPGSSDGTIDFRSFTMSILADMDANDTASVVFGETGGSTGQVDVSEAESFFSGYLVC